jgi:hypothetical protein
LLVAGRLESVDEKEGFPMGKQLLYLLHDVSYYTRQTKGLQGGLSVGDRSSVDMPLHPC